MTDSSIDQSLHALIRAQSTSLPQPELLWPGMALLTALTSALTVLLLG